MVDLLHNLQLNEPDNNLNKIPRLRLKNNLGYWLKFNTSFSFFSLLDNILQRTLTEDPNINKKNMPRSCPRLNSTEIASFFQRILPFLTFDITLPLDEILYTAKEPFGLSSLHLKSFHTCVVHLIFKEHLFTHGNGSI